MKRKLLLATPPTVTMTSPVVAPGGTVALNELSVQELRVVAATPLKVTVLEPCEGPKFCPTIVTVVPTAAGFAKMLVMTGVSGPTVICAVSETVA
jgi:hypothetical protein